MQARTRTPFLTRDYEVQPMKRKVLNWLGKEGKERETEMTYRWTIRAHQLTGKA